MQNEYDLQNFIAENPWLLSPNYEAVPQLPRGGLEYQAGSQKRIDLILRDKTQGTPVVIEFKATPFYRENIGQILEYKARIALIFNKEENTLFRVFHDFVLTPQLVLVVKECDSFSRIACNLSGIQVFEYKDFSRIFGDPDKIKGIADFTNALLGDRFPLSIDRHEQLALNIYQPIKDILRAYGLQDEWKEPQSSNAYFQPQYANMFINRWMLRDREVSIGLTEDILGDFRINIIYYSTDKERFSAFSEAYRTSFGFSGKAEWTEWNEGFVYVAFDRSTFFANPADIFKAELDKYLFIENKIQKKDTEGG